MKDQEIKVLKWLQDSADLRTSVGCARATSLIQDLIKNLLCLHRTPSDDLWNLCLNKSEVFWWQNEAGGFNVMADWCIEYQDEHPLAHQWKFSEGPVWNLNVCVVCETADSEGADDRRKHQDSDGGRETDGEGRVGQPVRKNTL